MSCIMIDANLMQVGAYTQTMAIGVILILAMALNRR